MTKKITARDAADYALIPKAEKFVASIFLGTGKYAKREAATLDEARKAGEALATEHKTQRKPMVYALAGSRHILVPPDYVLPEPKKETNDMPAKFPRNSLQPAAPAVKKKAIAVAKVPSGQRAAIEAAAKAGKLPEPPDFSAETHKGYRGKLEEVIKLAKAKDAKGLKAYAMEPKSSSRAAICRYRDLCITALQAR